ncbi:Uncharacterised protein [Klebsiella quasipneumoniae]|nr:Uncharacterised protein [Klebsiella quasipneumoniae]
MLTKFNHCTTNTVCINSDRTRNNNTQMVIKIMVKQKCCTVINSSQVCIFWTIVDKNFINCNRLTILILNLTFYRSFRTKSDFISTVFRCLNFLDRIFSLEL